MVDPSSADTIMLDLGSASTTWRTVACEHVVSISPSSDSLLLQPDRQSRVHRDPVVIEGTLGDGASLFHESCPLISGEGPQLPPGVEAGFEEDLTAKIVPHTSQEGLVEQEVIEPATIEPPGGHMIDQVPHRLVRVEQVRTELRKEWM